MHRGNTTRRMMTGLLAAAAVVRPARAATSIRIGTLRFGSLAWEMDVIRHHGLDRGFTLEPVEFASGPASQTALQAGAVDMVLQDWIWTSRLRSDGADWTFAPATAALGAIVVPADSPIKGLTDLRGRRLGIAGGPLDKSWLLLRLYGERETRLDLDTVVEKVFGPPPLLATQLDLGRLDAMLTYWPFVARAEAQGRRVVIDMADVLAGLGVPRGLPILGYVFAEPWAVANRDALTAFLTAAAQARQILMTSDAEWTRISPLTGTSDSAELTQLRNWYRRGAIGPWTDDVRLAADRLFALFASIGGAALVGSARSLAPGTFWQAG